MSGRLLASLAFCLQRRVEANEKRTTPISSYLDRTSLVKKGFIYFMDKLPWVSLATVFSKQSKGFLSACRNTAAYCIFLPFGIPDSGSKYRRYQVFIRYHWASAGMMKGNRLSKRKRNVLRRDDYFYFHHYSFQICITDQAWDGQHDWIYGPIFFFSFC